MIDHTLQTVKALVFVLAALAPALVFAELSPHCDPVDESLLSPYEMSRFRQISETIEAIEVSPFAKACHHPPGLLNGRPKTGLFRRALPETDSQGRTSRKLLTDLALAAISDIEGELHFLDAIDGCMGGRLEKKSEVCKVVEEWKTSLDETVREARIDLALSINASQYETLIKRSGLVDANMGLDPHGTFKKTKWQVLNAEEAQLTKQILKEYRNESEAEAKKYGLLPGTEAHKKFVQDAILGARLKNWSNYVKTISTHPILQYLTRYPIDRNELQTAIRELRGHLRSDRAMAQAKLTALNTTTAPIVNEFGIEIGKQSLPTPASALTLLDFQPQLERLLLAKPEFCGLATSLVLTKENRKIGNQLAIGIPIAVTGIALPFFTPWVVGAGFGAAAGGLAVLESKLERDYAFQRFMAVLEHENATEKPASERYQDLMRADKELKVSLFLPPAGAILGGGAKTIEVTKAALNIGVRMSSRAKNQLFSKGKRG